MSLPGCPEVVLFVVVLLALEDRASTIELLGEDEAHHLVGECHVGEGDHCLGTLIDCLGETIRSADDKDEVAACRLALAEPSGKLDAAALLTTLVEQHETVLWLHIL